MWWLIGAAGAVLVAGAAYRKRSLSLSGMLAAILMGTVYFGAGSLFWFGMLLLFFATSTMLSRLWHEQKADLEASYDKTGTRDAGQVFANGGIGMLLVIGYALYPSEAWVYLFIGAMATVTADTWATEIGTLSRKPPVSVLTFRRITTGESGGVSLPGTIAAGGGALLIGVAAWLLQALAPLGGTAPPMAPTVLAGLLGGVAGAFADSLLGATVQRMRRCTVCGREVESRQHCGRETVYARGWRWMDNDAVNAISSLAGAGVALAAGLFLA